MEMPGGGPPDESRDSGGFGACSRDERHLPGCAEPGGDGGVQSSEGQGARSSHRSQGCGPTVA